MFFQSVSRAMYSDKIINSFYSNTIERKKSRANLPMNLHGSEVFYKVLFVTISKNS